MLRIAVCDDEDQMVQNHIKSLEEGLKEVGIGGDIIPYTSSENLLYDITEDKFHYDLMLLDIEMPGCTGMEVAEKVKPYLPNVKIIFITSHIEYAIDAFELAIFRYVPKNDIAKRLPTAIRDALKLLELEDGKVYTIQNRSRLEKIPYREILNIEKDGKNAVIFTEDEEYKVRKSLQQVYSELEAEEFIYIDRGCIVNMIYIMQIKDGMAVLRNGTALPISRSHLQEVKEEINTYWGKHI